MKIHKRYTGKARIEIIPLLDVIFLLLVAFILFTMSMTIHRGLPVQLPASSTAMIEKKNFADITIREDGKIFFDKQDVNLSELISQLTILHRESPEIKVLMSGDKKVPYEMIIAVMDAVRKSGIHGISLETKWKE
ncbi:MAG: biopolymer transporter ExbD [Thermodesulfobacteriota bacterium]|nr:biopolymer transporter ExbD [Thermodesulfobacteriota bacterium]